MPSQTEVMQPCTRPNARSVDPRSRSEIPLSTFLLILYRGSAGGGLCLSVWIEQRVCLCNAAAMSTGASAQAPGR
jgi:hypothetical protein